MEALERRASRWSSGEAFAYCEGIARAHYENFPVASRLLPRRLRPHLCSLYAFARIADDFADEPVHEGRRLEELDAWERRLDLCLQGEADHPVFVALGCSIREHAIPDQPLRDLLNAFRQDCRIRRYESWEDLTAYSRLSANPVGRLVLHLFEYRDEERARLSDAICTALQFANFWQDVAVDLRKNRIYLPADDRRRWGVGEESLAAGHVGEGFRGLMEEMVSRTRRLFEEGHVLIERVDGRLRLELRLVWLGGTRILERIEEVDFDVFRRRPTLRGVDRLGLVGRALLGHLSRR